MTDLLGIPLSALAPGAIAGIAVLLVLTGRLHTNAEMRRVVRAHEAELERIREAHVRELEDAQHERSEWRIEARLNQQTIVELTEQNQAMLSAFGPTLTDFLENMRRLATKVRGEERERA